MGLRGPVPRRAGNKIATATQPKPPAGTPPEVRKLFRLIVKGNPHLTPGETLEILTYARAKRLEEMAFEQMLTDGIWIYDTTHGDGSEKRRHPNVITWRTACEVARQTAMRLGITPLDRQRVAGQEVDEMEELEALLAGVEMG